LFDLLIVRLALALLIGLLVGLERGWRKRDMPAGSRTAGIRTYGLSGLLGGLLAALSQAFGSSVLFAFGFVGFAAVFGWFKWQEEKRAGTVSVTGVVAALAVFALGGLAVVGNYVAAAAAGVALAGVLASREPLHALLRRISWTELRSVLLLAGMTAIVLPLLPNRTIDPWGGFNPWEIWFFTVLTAAISYGGYVAVRVLGPAKGILVSGLAGALVSSTAVTVAFGRRASTGEDTRPLAAGASLAAMISALRVLAIVAIVKPELALWIAPPASAAALVFGAFGIVLLWRNSPDTSADPKLGNPFDLGPLLLFAASFAVVALTSATLARNFGSSGVVLTSGFSGIVDVDVASLSAARLAGNMIPLSTAAEGILLAILLNAAMRVVAAFATGPRSYSLVLLAASLAATSAGLLALAFFSAFTGRV
jgi:uncharacterized membrane protein (DUF4010 family)